MPDGMIDRVEYEESVEAVQWLCTVMRRGRGIWLADWSESLDGTSDFDAFPTRAQAVAWCAHAVGVNRLPWEKVKDRQVWHAELIVRGEA